ncbi:MAG TPA: hypothetical protein DCW49_06905 [Alteromonas australica]|nr:hypothetical protein [Alteromonas australica]
MNREHPSVEMHLADIERTTMDTPIKKRVVAQQKLTLIRPLTTQPTTQKVALKKPVPQTSNSTSWIPVSDKAVQVALVDPLSVAGTRPRYAESRGAVAEEPVQEKKNAMKSRWEVSARALHMRPFEYQTFIKPLDRETTVSFGGGSTQHPTTARIKPEYHSGFEGRIAYAVPDSNWNLSSTGQFFSMYAHHMDAVPSHGDGSFYLSEVNIGFKGRTGARFEVGDGVLYAAQSSTVVSLISFDAEYNFEEVPQVSVLGGLKFGGIHRSLDVNLDHGHSINPGKITSNNDTTFLGVGPNFGLAIAQPVFGNLGMRLNFSAALLGGVSRVQSSNTTAESTNEGVFESHYRKSVFHFVPVTDASIAMRYAQNIWSDVHGEAEIGFTTQHWLGLHDFMRDTFDEGDGTMDTTIVGSFGPYFKAKVTW